VPAIPLAGQVVRKGTTNMDVKEITQKIIDTYKVAQPLYKNHTPLYGSDVPICPPDGEMYEMLYKLFSYFHDTKPEILDAIDKVNDTITILDLLDYLEPIKETLPDEYKLPFQVFLKMIQLCSLANKPNC
jgi:hypothetical protein